MIEIENFTRSHIKEIEPYSSAKDEYDREGGTFLDANENPYGNNNRYPDPHQHELKKELSTIKKVKKEQIFIGNGSDEIIDLLYKLFCKPASDKAVIFTPTFGMYETSARINRVEAMKIPLNESFQIDLDDKLRGRIQFVSTKLMFICSPNNPTGNSINSATIEYLISTFDGMVVIDEAYIDFSENKSWLRSIDEYKNLIVLQTLSKAWGMAGLRIGMAFTNPEVVSYLNKIKPPYNVSSVNQQTALKRLKDRGQHRKQVIKIMDERERVAEALQTCTSVKKVFPSEANFILAEVDNADRVYKELKNQKIIVRNRSNQIKNGLRITIGTAEENDRLITAFKNMTI